MHDELNAIRRLYGEPGISDPPPDAQAVPAALAEMKAALDALPPQRPDAFVIDAVVAAAGEAAWAAALGPIRQVYDEEPEPLVSAQAESEAAVLAQMKAALDRLPPQRPDLAVIDAVVATAALPSRPVPVGATAGRAADRPARAAPRRGVVAALSAVFALVLVFGGGLWLSRDTAAPREIASADRFEAEKQEVDAAPLVAEGSAEDALEEPASAAPTEVTGPLAAAAPQRTASPAPANEIVQNERARLADAMAADVPAASARRDMTTAPAAPNAAPNAEMAALSADRAKVEGATLASEEALPLTDGDEELQLLYLRVREMQAAQAGLGWDTPLVPLGIAPDSVPAATGWMQVRVQR